MKSLIFILILLLSFTKVHGRSVNFDTDENSEWKSGYHPFPEMSRFLNSYSRIHYQSLRKTSAYRPPYSLLQYICSIANKREHLEEILLIFGQNYRSIIKTIIKHDCPNNKRGQQTTIDINEKNFSHILSRNSRRKL